MTTEQPDWLLRLQRDLCTPVMVPDGAIINWDQCRDRFLIPLLQRLEPQTRSSHPAIVRQLLQRRLAGDDVAAELSAASLAATAAASLAASLAATERTAQLADLQAAIAATAAASLSASLAATAAASLATAAASLAASLAAIYATSAAATERTAQLADLQAAIAAATQPAAFPVDLAALRDSTFSDGLTAAPHIEVLRGGPDPRLPAPGEVTDFWLEYCGTGIRLKCDRCGAIEAVPRYMLLETVERRMANWARRHGHCPPTPAAAAP